MTAPHWHKWEIVAVSHNRFVDESYTNILYRCSVCNNIKTRRLYGTWLLEQLIPSGQEAP